jgi:enediyne biosynthesis protein E4
VRVRPQDPSCGAPLCLLLVLCGGAASCTSELAAPASEQSRPTNADQTAAVRPDTRDEAWFVDRAAEAGIDFVHFNGMSGRFYQPEIMGPGVALFDYDNDGDLDVYVVQGGVLGTGRPLTAPPKGPLTDRLYRNDLVIRADGTRTLHFTDVTEQSGLKSRGYGMGVAVGDFDNDGWVDLYRTAWGPNQLFRNNGDGTFTDVSARTGTSNSGWSVSAAFVDIDRDGWLDLFVGNYLRYTLETHTPCFNPSGPPDYCPPDVYRAQPSRIYRNRGDGTFVDVTAAAGLAREFGPALGVATADFNGDGWIDIFVANDQKENQLWINQQDGTFRNMAPLWGVAAGPNGELKANMGVDAGDFDNDGDEDLFITELTGQGSTLYVNAGTGVFDDQSVRQGIHVPSLAYTGFGAAWLDFDNDSWLDIMAVNGYVTQKLEALGPDNPFPLQQRKQVFHNRRTGGFEEVTNRAGAVFQPSEVSRGAAFGDIDNDGDVDVLIGNAAGPARLLINQIGSRNHWLGLRLRQTRDDREQSRTVEGRDMVGARVAVVLTSGSTVWRRARTDGSYASANDPRVLVGLGESAAPVQVRVTWPNGRVETWSNVLADRYTTLREGEGQ